MWCETVSWWGGGGRDVMIFIFVEKNQIRIRVPRYLLGTVSRKK